ncbi:Myo-inositol-1-phosphate synthase [Marasmius tenuissimus]|uniref:Myo-inositol-1-phosphate synthase n=1 Tax=Marasmius tenuissimus TaxID=585030 RepID=A0ABR2Z5T6_9AGAR
MWVGLRGASRLGLGVPIGKGEHPANHIVAIQYVSTVPIWRETSTSTIPPAAGGRLIIKMCELALSLIVDFAIITQLLAFAQHSKVSEESTAHLT